MYDFKNKEINLKQYNNYTLSKTLAMFEYANLPETLPAVELEKMLQRNGFVFITEFENKIYAFNGVLGGVQDVYYNPTTININNPALNFNKTLSILNDGVLFRNDDLSMGLIPLFNRYNSMIVENDISMLMVGYNSRMNTLISASDDKTKQSAEIFLNKMIQGDIGIIGETVLFDGVKVHNSTSSKNGSITDLIELHQYLKGGLYNEIGLKSNFNMKRERLTSGEIESVEDELHPFINNMFRNRQTAIRKINEKYNLNIIVDYASIWDKKNYDLTKDLPETGGVLSTHNSESLPKDSSSTSEVELSNISTTTISNDINKVDENKATTQTTETPQTIENLGTAQTNWINNDDTRDTIIDPGDDSNIPGVNTDDIRSVDNADSGDMLPGDIHNIPGDGDSISVTVTDNDSIATNESQEVVDDGLKVVGPTRLDQDIEVVEDDVEDDVEDVEEVKK